jgi:hypothetical protein
VSGEAAELPFLEAEAKGPMRRCVAARAPRPAAGMIRFVVGPDRDLVPDLANRLPGRGLWLSAERSAVQGAVKRNLFAKAARAQVRAEPDLADRLEALLVRRCLDLVGLARRGGGLVAGFDQVADWLKNGRAALVLQARDAAEDGRRKVRSMARGKVPSVEAFGRAELGSAIGRDDVVHVALAPGGIERRLRAELGRLRGFRDFEAPATVPDDDGGDAATAVMTATATTTEREEGISRI